MPGLPEEAGPRRVFQSASPGSPSLGTPVKGSQRHSAPLGMGTGVEEVGGLLSGLACGGSCREWSAGAALER